MSLAQGRPRLREWQPPRPPGALSHLQERCQNAKKLPFLDQQPMVGEPGCAWADFRHPRLRRFDLQDKIEWKERLGHGIDGVVWRASCSGHEFAFKVFWDSSPPKEPRRYWAPQIECHNAALLQMIHAAVEASTEPIYLYPEPKTKNEAVANLRAFSDEGRRKQEFRSTPGAVQFVSMPRMRKCFGWMKVTGRELCELPVELRPPAVRIDRLVREIWWDQEYYCVAYEFIPDYRLPLDLEVVQSSLDLLWLAGFSIPLIRRENWMAPGLLLDMADICCPWHAGWFASQYQRTIAKDWFRSNSPIEDGPHQSERLMFCAR